jgi:hypothetical protein
MPNSQVPSKFQTWLLRFVWDLGFDPWNFRRAAAASGMPKSQDPNPKQIPSVKQSNSENERATAARNAQNPRSPNSSKRSQLFDLLAFGDLNFCLGFGF